MTCLIYVAAATEKTKPQGYESSSLEPRGRISPDNLFRQGAEFDTPKAPDEAVALMGGLDYIWLTRIITGFEQVRYNDNSIERSLKSCHIDYWRS
jgi:hypothetical protein